MIDKESGNVIGIILEEFNTGLPKDPSPKPQSYCPECDGWKEDCTHGRYTGPYADIMNGGNL